MFPLNRRSVLVNRVVGWVLFVVVASVAFLFFGMSLGVAMIAVFAALFSAVALSAVFLIRSKLAYGRRERALMGAGRIGQSHG